jgi:hypothetical protein
MLRPVRRILVWLVMLAAIGVLAYVISIPHSERPCLVVHRGDCGQTESHI